MSILQPNMPLICMIGSQNVTFLFRRPRNVWRTIGRRFFSSVSLSEWCRLIISHLTARRMAASPLVLLLRVNVAFLKVVMGGRRNRTGVLLTDADGCVFTSAVYLKITQIRHKEMRPRRLPLSEILHLNHTTSIYNHISMSMWCFYWEQQGDCL